MKKLTIIRHAKSDWSFDVPDMERTNSKRGKNDVKIMAELIDTVDCFPQIIYSSPSKRTVQTYEFFLKYSTVFKNIEFQESDQLYDFSGYNVLEFIRNIDDAYSSVMLFSHNNSCSFLTAELGGEYKHVPTCGIIIFDFDVSLWSQISNGKLNHYFPKSYR